MSLHDFALLAPPPHHADHFASAFLHPFHHHPPPPPPPALDFHRYHPHSLPALDYPLPSPTAAAAAAASAAAAAAVVTTPTTTTTTNSAYLTRDHHSHTHQPPPLRAFDPRPPHAGWTPKEEIVDDDEQTRELLARSPATSLTSPTDQSPEDTAHSPTAAASSKTYSFVSLPGNAVRKRPRRRYDEIERLYACAWPGCTKAYGTLNHLNAHVSMQRHGPKRSPAEFKELRKQWRQQKKQDAGATSTSTSSTAEVAITSDAASSGSTPTPTPSTSIRRRRGTEPTLAPPTMHPRLSLGDLRFPPPHSDNEGPSPTSTASDSAAYWQDSPVSPPLARLPPDSTLLTPLPGYRAPTPPAGVGMGMGMVQSHAHTQSPHAHLLHLAGSSPHEAYDEYDARRT